MQKEQTIILTPATSKKIIDIKEQIILEAVERNIHNSTIITANLIRNTVYVTSSSEAFIKDLSSNKDFIVNAEVLPMLN